jgi:4-hydroxy-3-methylbut-2-enyl diphosphate reductase
MEIIIAKNSGLCYGVRRALRMAKNARSRQGDQVFTLGELIHNPQVIADLEKQGLRSIEDLESIHSGTVIIRSHGVAPEIYKILKKKNIGIIDATCPIVTKIQKLVESLAKENEEIIIVGNREHPEIKGLVGYSRGKGKVVENEAQAHSLPRKKRRAVLAQSTQDLFLFSRVVAVLIKKTGELKVYNTICRSTQTRQKSTSELAAQVDTLFIVGGKNSSNTNKLYQISKRILPQTYLIENARQITPRLLKGAKRIGISGGASTPPEAIAEAVAKIRNSFQRQSQRENFVQCQT